MRYPKIVFFFLPRDEEISCLAFVGVFELKKVSDFWKLIIWHDACP